VNSLSKTIIIEKKEDIETTVTGDGKGDGPHAGCAWAAGREKWASDK